MGRGHLLNLEISPDVLSQLRFTTKKIYLSDLESSNKTNPWLGCLT